MSLSLKLAWRNIFRRKRRSLLTIFTMTGSFVLASMSIGWMEGSYGNMILFFTEHRTGQVQIHAEGYLDDPSIYDTVDRYQDVGSTIASLEEVKAWAPRIYAGALLASREPGAPPGIFSNSAAVSITGIDPVLETAATSFPEQITEGEMLTSSAADTVFTATGQILLGRDLALTLEAGPGDSLVLFSQAVDGSSADRSYLVKGIVTTGSNDLDRTAAYITLADAQLLFALEGRVHEIAVMTGSLDKVASLTSRLQQMLSPDSLSVESWQVFAREFHNGMQADEASLRIILGIIIGMAALGVLNTILMMVLERRREFGVMKAMGTGPGRIVKMIVLEANIMALMSIVAGSILSTAGLLLLSRHGWVLDPPLDYAGFTFREMVATITPGCYWIPAVCIIITASLVSLLPAMKAARTDPARTLRTV